MLRYTGGGFGGALPGIPARDLTDDEVKQHGGEQTLIATGLYARELPAESKMRPGGAENKSASQDGE
jgi:hypothetical protein